MNKLIPISIIILLSYSSFHPINTIELQTRSFNRKPILIVGASNKNTDTVLLINISTEILKTIKKSDYTKFASFIHPKYGVRCSPHAYVDTIHNRVLTSALFLKLVKLNKHVDWGSAWEGKPELLTIKQYFKKFVYDVDFLNAPLISANKFHSHGTDLNNIAEVYPACDIIEFYFPGFKNENEGMDFRGLRLVFKSYNKKPYLVAIVHDEWTP